VLRPQSGVRSHCRKSFFAEMLARSFSRESGGKLPDIHHYLKRLTAHNAVCKELIAAGRNISFNWARVFRNQRVFRDGSQTRDRSEALDRLSAKGGHC
jgi:hypothetical protein